MKCYIEKKSQTNNLLVDQTDHLLIKIKSFRFGYIFFIGFDVSLFC